MANFTKSNVSYKAVKGYITAFDPTDVVAMNIPDRTITTENDNVDASIAYLESNYVFERMAWFKNAKISDAFENEVKDEVDDCDIGEWRKSSEISVTFAADRLTTLDLEARKILLWFDFNSEIWAPVVWDTYTLSADSRQQDKFYRLPYQHHDANGNIIKPVTYAVTAGGAPITDNTDYRIVKNSFWEFGIELYSTVATTNEIIVTYDHTTIDANYGGYKAASTTQPYIILKLETCPDEDWKVHYYYITKMALSGTLDINFVAKWEVPLSPITLKQGLWGDKYFKKEV